MKNAPAGSHRILAALACVVPLAGLIALSPAGAARAQESSLVAFIDDFGVFDDTNWTLRELQRQGIASQEEQAREAGRILRRAEIERAQQKAASEHAAFFDAVLDTSQAALRAPIGAYYRKPGTTSSEAPPAGSSLIAVGGMSYLYDNGVFWLQQGNQYIVVTAPLGAVVEKLPSSAIRVASKEGAVYYSFGIFYGPQGSGYHVVKPAAGTLVFYLPDGYTPEKLKDLDVYRFGDTLFRPVFIQGVLAYQVQGT